VRLLTTFLALAFCGKLLDLAYTLWRQITIDIFFIDWEKPRGTLSEAAFQSERARRAPGDPATAAAAAASATFGRTRGSLGGGTEDDGGGGGPDVADSAAMAERKDDSSEVPLPVSVWRRVFVINKFNELQSARQVDISLTLFWLLLFLRGLGLEYLATAQPSASDLDPDAAPLHPLLRFAVAIFFWLLVAGCQIVLRFAVYNRYLRDAAAQFVDLLCSTNVSCLILDHRYHGWYIHGKSVHAHADTSLEEMNLQIAYEQRNWTKPRGLVEGKDAFELLVSRQFRARYDKIYSSLLAKELQRRQTARRRGAQGLSARERQAIEVAGARLGAAGGAGGGGGGGAGGATLEIDSEKTLLLSDRLMAASAALNEFLKSFVEKHEPQHFPWEEGFRTFFERRFGLPPTVQQDSLVSFFFEDAGLDFTRTLLMGIERDVILFLIIFYALADLAFGNTFVSVLLTYLCDRAITAARAHWGRINLSQKTLIDDRFLL
jgi:meckelin